MTVVEGRSSAPPQRPGMAGVARGGLLNLVGAGVSAVSGVVLVVVVTRALPQAEAGVFFTLISVFLLAGVVARAGTGAGLVYFTAGLRSRGRKQDVRAFQRVAIVPVVAVSLLVAAVLAASAPWVAETVGGQADGARLAVLLLAVLLPLTTLSDTVLAGTRGHGTMVPTVALDSLARPLLQLAGVALTVGGGSVAVVAGVWALPWALSAVLGGWWLSRLGRDLPARGARPDADTWRTFWRFTGPRAVTSVVAIALQRLDIVLVGVLAGPAQAAVYTAATRFLVVGQLVGTAISNAAQPALAGLLAVDDRVGARHLYQSATAWIVLLAWPLYLLAAVFAEEVLGVFGPGYAAGRPVVLVLAGVMLVATACGMVDMLLTMAGRTTATLVNSLAALGVMLTLDLLLIPRFGILGAAVGWAAAILVKNLLPLLRLHTELRLHPFGRATLSAAGLAAAAFGALPWLVAGALPGSAGTVVVAVLVGGAAYAAAVLRWSAALDLPPLRALRPRRATPSHPRAVPGPSTPGGDP